MPLLLGGIVLAALAVRSIGIHNVFPSDGRILLEIYDASFHARRALYTFINFPSVLLFDPYLRYPEGAPVPVPPLYDWCLGAVARLFGDSVRTFETVAAWSSPALGVLTIFPVFAAGRILAGAWVGLGAAAIYALLPVSIEFAGIGNCDHHAAISLLAALLLWLGMSATSEACRGRRLAGVALGIAAIQTAIVLSWTGSLLYIGLGSGALLLAAAVAGRRDLLIALGASAVAAAIAVGAWVAAVGTPYGGPFSGPLSWLQVVALFGAGSVGLALAGLDTMRPSPSLRVTLLRGAGLSVAGILGLLAFPEVREALLPVFNVLTRTDTWGPTNVEQRPLFAWSLAWRSPTQLYGYFAYAIPLAMLAPLLRARDDAKRPAAAFATCWSLGLGLLALQQIRFGGDFAPVAAVAFALLLAEVPRRIRAWRPQAPAAWTAIAPLLGIGLLWPALAEVHLARLPRTLAHFGVVATSGESPARTSPKHTVVRFAEMLREATPETSGYLDSAAAPEYSVLVPPSFGHVVYYVSRRPPTANNMGPYLDPEKFAATEAFFFARTEAEGVEIASSLGARFVLTAAREQQQPPFLDYRLHRLDGTAHGDQEHLEHFRLVTEGPGGGRPLRLSFPRLVPRRVVPYKLFERVTGAVISASGTPGAEGLAEISVVTPLGREFVFRARALVDSDGGVQWRVPYPTGATGAVRTAARYQIRIGTADLVATVSEADIEVGRTVTAAAP